MEGRLEAEVARGVSSPSHAWVRVQAWQDPQSDSSAQATPSRGGLSLCRRVSLASGLPEGGPVTQRQG